MIKRSRANRTEKATYRNNRNEHKFIDVVHQHSKASNEKQLQIEKILLDCSALMSATITPRKQKQPSKRR